MKSRIFVIFSLLLSSPFLSANEERNINNPTKSTKFTPLHEVEIDYTLPAQRENMASLVSQKIIKRKPKPVSLCEVAKRLRNLSNKSNSKFEVDGIDCSRN